jgi:hypothetical protein
MNDKCIVDFFYKNSHNFLHRFLTKVAPPKAHASREGGKMLTVLQWIYGPNAESDPYYQVMHDLIALLPWWYPLMWAVIIGSLVAWRLGRRWRRRRQNRLGLRRVRSRVRRLADMPESGAWILAAANDDLPASLSRRVAAE